MVMRKMELMLMKIKRNSRGESLGKDQIYVLYRILIFLKRIKRRFYRCYRQDMLDWRRS